MQPLQENFFTKITKTISNKYVMIPLIAIIFGLVGYFVYNKYVVTSPSTTFNANREHNPAAITGTPKTANLMLFYVDWCPHCKTAKPEWDKLKTDYEGQIINGYNVEFTEYNCTDETGDIEKLVDAYKIEGYPTIKLVKDDQLINFDAKPSNELIKEFLNTVL